MKDIIIPAFISDNDFESSVITEALIQGQMHPREYSNNVLSSITNLLMVYMNENHLFSLVTEVFIAVLKLMKISDFHRAWQNSTKHNNKLVWFNVLWLHVMRCAISYYLYNLKNVKSTYRGALLLVNLQAKSPQLY